ncbi:MAG: tandem-95 repeat protein, partial [Candidatus Promineifilaceae bacterium]|nr:tandem-95 repeat protein [Candidatus Promineifilaceae bacterium]
LAPNSANTACATCTLPADGSLANNGDGTFDYNPDLDFNGSDNFVYEICDTLAACDTATVTITVSAVPDAPEANDDDAITQQDTPVPIDVAANDSDPEGDLDPTTTNTACPSCTSPAGSLVNNGDGSFNYTPPPGFTGVDSFVYEICDLGGLCSTAAVSITVTPSTPTTFEVRVAAASDDGEERATGSMYLNSSDLELIFDKDNQKVGIRFAGVNIPPGATIDKAYLQFQADEATSEITNLTIAGEASANPLTFTTANGNISARTLTNASVSWSPPPWLTVGAAGVEQQTADIAPIIQELVQPSSGWISGNAMVFIITGSGKRVAEAFNGAAAAAPLLHVEYFDLQ